MSKVLLTLTFLLMGASSAIAVTLVNKDSRSYEVRAVYNGQSNDTSIDAASAVEICPTSCRIEVKGVGTIQASQSDTVVIENGAIAK